MGSEPIGFAACLHNLRKCQIFFLLRSSGTLPEFLSTAEELWILLCKNTLNQGVSEIQ